MNRWLVERGLLDISGSPTFGVVVETGCRFHASLAFPDRVTVGLRVAHLGTSSVRYELGIFRNDDTAACATGHFVHVYVDRESRRPTPMPTAIRAALESLRRAERDPLP